MQLDDVGDVIAERELEIEDGRPVLVQIGKPQRDPDVGGDFYCPFQMTGIGNEKIRYACGVDTVQALVLTLNMIAAELYTSDEARSGKLTWLGQRNLGIPVNHVIQDLIPEDDA